MTSNEIFTLIIALIAFIGGFMFGIYYPENVVVTKKELEYMSSLECDNSATCSKGALCNSCWVRKWAIDKLNKYFGGYK